MRKLLRNSPLCIRPTQHDFARPSPSPSFSMRRIVHVGLARACPEARSPLNPGILKLTDGSLSILSRPSCFVPYPSTKLAWSELAIQTPKLDVGVTVNGSVISGIVLRELNVVRRDGKAANCHGHLVSFGVVLMNSEVWLTWNLDDTWMIFMPFPFNRDAQ
ncbi:hypothetical protein BT96DRAFT_506490 [Gymnopus androsaceus JB14]|uniref:Uncharacterized protein n=1 Tax=Gymnopus androsaceus JB14 TaxID=1447944 RepID=A0A6A4GND7_9AGAR|nr:hypothetical protein BT96DRAFT_506490 [Gymnopus androsaceus JB14]